jgi:NADH:ubiquinone oxidoreductase subunit 6 (subunit J)
MSPRYPFFMNLLPTISITRFVVNLSQAFYAVRLFLEKNITSCATFIAFFALSVPVLSFFSWAIDVAVFSACSSGESFFLELVLPVVACVCAVLVSSVSNPMHALLSLLGVFFTTTLILLSLGINYLGYGFLIIYVGAIAILFLFVIMLFNVKVLTVSSNLVQYLSQVIVGLRFYTHKTTLLLHYIALLVAAWAGRPLWNQLPEKLSFCMCADLRWIFTVLFHFTLHTVFYS